MKIALVNASAPVYNLGLAKARRWWQRQGAQVTMLSTLLPMETPDFDVVWVSVIFSWHIPRALEVIRQAQFFRRSCEIGGPGTFGVRQLIKDRTGLKAQATPDPRFEREPGAYPMIFWSRGCPAKNCTLGFPRDGALPVCSVPAMEGWRYTLYDEVTPAPIILDNNLSALPRAHQELIVERTLAAGFREVDANSGFEPRSFRPDTAFRWNRLPLKCWRFAYDEIAERKAVLRMMEILDEANIPRRDRRIYCLAGNEPIESCEQRVREIASWGCLAIVQRRRPLDWIGGPLPVLYDWTEQRLIDFQRWGNRLAKSMPFSHYVRGLKGVKAKESADAH